MSVLLRKLGEVTGELIRADDIEVCHRVPVAKNPSENNIVVQFTRRFISATWYSRRHGA